MRDAPAEYALPSAAPIRWLTEPGAETTPDIRAKLVAGFFTSVVPLLLGGLVNLAVNLVAAIRHPEAAFLVLAGLDAALLIARAFLLGRCHRAAARGERSPTDLFFATSLAWAALVGCGTALCFATSDPVLQVLAPLTMMGILSGIVTRNNAAPRLAIAQIVLCDLPLKLVIPFCGEPWLLVALAQFPLLLLSMIGTVYRLNRGYLAVVMAERESERRATHDALTGLWNRPALMAALSRNLHRRAREQGGGEPAGGAARAAAPGSVERFALLYLDLDGFKAINDGLGHRAGDRLLQQAAARAAASVPEGCVVARIGGDEFVILAPDRGVREAEAIADEVIAALSQPYDLGLGDEARIGVSIGIACTTADMTPESLLEEADAALYRAKAGGKGRYVLASDHARAQQAA